MSPDAAARGSILDGALDHISNRAVAPRHVALYPRIYSCARRYVIVAAMRLADRIAQCRTPFIVEDTKDRRQTRLIGASDFADAITACPVRYCLSDDLVALCCALAYSKGARTLECADLLHVPAERVWIEWCEAPWINELARYGFPTGAGAAKIAGRRGAFVQTSPQGRQGLIKTFWTCGDTDLDVLASSMEAYFDFDVAEGQDPMAPDGLNRPAISVLDRTKRRPDILRRYFRFRYERSWDDYYARARVPLDQKNSLVRHALGTIAIDIPVLLVFFLLLGARPGLPRRPLILERLNQARINSGRAPLLEHIEVSSPLLPEYRPSSSLESSGHHRRAPRLHHVRGHLVRRGSQLFWRVPHLRGSTRSGVIRSRTVTWTLDHPVSNV